MNNVPISSDVLRGHLESIILTLINDQDRYGYEIVNEIKKRTNGNYLMKEATLYAMVQRLEKKEVITSYIGDKSHGRKRKYYKITTLGKAYLYEKKQEWKTLKSLMALFLEDTNETA